MHEAIWAWRISGIEALEYNYCDEISLKASYSINLLFTYELFYALNWLLLRASQSLKIKLL